MNNKPRPKPQALTPHLKYLRIIDANYNRAKEGLRVVEDIFRFVYENDRLRKETRATRHGLNKFITNDLLLEAAKTRDSSKDIGRAVDKLEINRKDEKDILRANLQRAKESLRVLEECMKITAPKKCVGIKKLRYKVYEIEKTILLDYCR